MKNKKNKHCCDPMYYAIKDTFCPIVYSDRLREYGIKDFDSDVSRRMFYCYYCATKLPTSLRDKWFNTLQKEYGIKATILTPLHKLPKEFHSDEWWKKRGL